jgi:uncharacterized protein YsxB (DUF464 family)
VIIIKNNIVKNESPFEYIIEGHAGYAEHGKDIICSGVSALHFSFLMWLNSESIEYEFIDDGNIVGVSVIDSRARECYNMVIRGFESIAEKYGEYVKIVYT